MTKESTRTPEDWIKKNVALTTYVQSSGNLQYLAEILYKLG